MQWLTNSSAATVEKPHQLEMQWLNCGPIVQRAIYCAAVFFFNVVFLFLLGVTGVRRSSCLAHLVKPFSLFNCCKYSFTLRYSIWGKQIRYKKLTPLFRRKVETTFVEGTFHSCHVTGANFSVLFSIKLEAILF